MGHGRQLDPVQPSNQPSNGGKVRRRLLRHFAPLAIAGGVVLVVFMNVAFFNANRYQVPLDIFTEGISGAFPSGDQPPNPMDPSGQTGTPPTDVGGGQGGAPPMDHGGGQTGTPPTDDGGGQGGAPPMDQSGVPTDDGADQTGTFPQGHAGDPETVVQMRRLSTATGYAATGLIGLTLLVGPANLLLRKRTPISSYLRRDVGIAATATSVVHMIFGFLVKHGDGQILSYFLAPSDRSRILTSSFGLANWAGLAGVVIIVGLAVISNDAALRRLKAKRWKRIQRLNYALFPLVIVHALLYGALWRDTSPYTVLLGLSVIAVLVGQAVGVRLWRQRNARTPATA